VTNRGDRLVGFHECAHNLHRIGIRAKRFDISQATGNDERVKVRRRNCFCQRVDFERVGFLVMNESLNFPFFYRYERHVRSSFFQHVPRRSQLDLLDTIGCKHRHFSSSKICRHPISRLLHDNRYKGQKTCQLRHTSLLTT